LISKEIQLNKGNIDSFNPNNFLSWLRFKNAVKYSSTMLLHGGLLSALRSGTVTHT